MTRSSVHQNRSAPFSLFPRAAGALFCLLFGALICLLPSAALAQGGGGDELPPDAAPPPLRVMSKDEKRMLDAESNAKKRTQLALTLLEARLKAAETHVAASKFQESINELGAFQALLEDTLKFLEKVDQNGKKVDDNFKRLEIGLRKTVPRIELVRRELPYRYGYYVLKVQKFVRDARARAVEPLFDDSVMPERKPSS